MVWLSQGVGEGAGLCALWGPLEAGGVAPLQLIQKPGWKGDPDLQLSLVLACAVGPHPGVVTTEAWPEEAEGTQSSNRHQNWGFPQERELCTSADWRKAGKDSVVLLIPEERIPTDSSVQSSGEFAGRFVCVLDGDFILPGSLYRQCHSPGFEPSMLVWFHS